MPDAKRNAKPSQAKLNWSTARVRGGELSVELEGEVKKDWTKSFKTTVTLLGNGDWGEVTLKKHAIRVAEVSPGDEEKLRHYLESVVAQANASQEPPEDSGKRADDNEHEQDGPDAEMTQRFRSFAEPSSEDEKGSRTASE